MHDVDDDLVCRCEEVTKREIIEAIKAGATTPDSIKKLTRAGMGLCQGRTCRNLVSKIIAEELDKESDSILPFTYRPPVRPITLDELATRIQCDMYPENPETTSAETQRGI